MYRDDEKKSLGFIKIAIVVLAFVLFFIFAWLANLFDGKITYVVDGEPYKAVKLIRTGAYKNPTPDDKPGYAFDGWYYDEGTFEEEFSLDDLPILYFFAETTVYAKYVEHDHNYEWQVVKAPTCSAFGEKAEKCTNGSCGSILKTEKIDKLEHTVTNGKLNLNITEEGKVFSYTASCDECNVTLDEDDVTVSEKINVLESCLQDGSYEYVYKAHGVEYKVNYTAPKLAHTLNGESVERFTSDGFIKYGTKNVFIDENEELICEQTASAHYICEECNRNIQVTVKRFHNEEDRVTLNPTCTTEGSKDVYCIDEDCKKFVCTRPIDSLGHSMSSRLERSTISGNVQIVSACTRENCNYETRVDADTRYISYTETNPATCYTKGERICKYKKGSVSLSFKEETPTLKHKIAGQIASDIADAEGRIPYGTKGIMYFNNIGEPECGGTVNGYYHCEVCYEIIGQPVFVSVYRAHKYVWSLDFKDSKNVDPDNRDFIAKGVCSVCSDTKFVTPDASDIDYEYTRPTCSTPGVHSYYYYKYNTEFGLISASFDLEAPVIAGEHILPDGRFLLDLAGTDGVAENIANLENTDTSVSYKYSLGGFSLFINGSTGGVAKCFHATNELLPGYIICDDCDEVVYIAVYVDHIISATDKVIKQPDCTKSGYRAKTCNDCGAEFVTQTLSALGHKFNYKYEAVLDGEELVEFDIIKYCTVCDYSKVDTTISKDDAKFKILSYGSCKEKGEGRYTFTHAGKTFTYDVTFQGSHILCGVSAETLKNEDGYHLSTQKGISLPEDYITLNDGDIVIGGYVCDVCKEFIESSVLVVVDDEE